MLKCSKLTTKYGTVRYKNSRKNVVNLQHHLVRNKSIALNDVENSQLEIASYKNILNKNVLDLQLDMTGDENVVEENMELGPFLLEPASLGNLNKGSPLKRRERG